LSKHRSKEHYEHLETYESINSSIPNTGNNSPVQLSFSSNPFICYPIKKINLPCFAVFSISTANDGEVSEKKLTCICIQKKKENEGEQAAAAIKGRESVDLW
jgi:hypothetical protein